MKDPIFVMQFEKLRYSIFPLNDYNINQEKLRFREEIKTNLLTLNDIDVTKLCTTAPFYVEDYISYYNKVKAQPDLRKWDKQEKGYNYYYYYYFYYIIIISGFNSL